MIEIRPMRADELPEVAALTNLAWRAAYLGLLDQDFLDGLTTQDRMARIQRRLEAGSQAWVADDAGTIAGIAVAGPSTIEEYPDDGELQMLYAHPEFIGQGVGHALIERACAELARAGHRHLILDVFAGNDRAIRFYRAHGFQTVRHASPVLDVGRTQFPLEFMRKPVAATDRSLSPAKSRPTVVLRPAEDTDEELVAGFLLELSDYNRARHSARCTTDDYSCVREAIRAGALKAFRERDEDVHVLIAEVAGLPVGYALSRVIEQKPEADNGTGRLGLLDEVYVEESSRGAGVGQHLIDASLAWLKDRGLTRIRLYAYAWNHGARALYERNGFTESSVCYELFTTAP